MANGVRVGFAEDRLLDDMQELCFVGDDYLRLSEECLRVSQYPPE